MITLEKKVEEIACNCVGKHIPLPITYYQVEVNGDVIWLCPTTYSNYHHLLTQVRAGGSMVPGSISKHYSKFVRDLVRETWSERVPGEVASGD